MVDIFSELVGLARLSLAGRKQDLNMFIRRLARRLRESHPDVSARLHELLLESPTRENPLRSAEVAAIPVDSDSRLQLARPEYPVILETDPVWTPEIQRALTQVVIERQREAELAAKHLTPTKSLLFVGPPGVGKSLAARWIAAALDRPLLVLDLSAVMSSFLGRTGTNVRYVLDYAKSTHCVLLLDEIDAIAKRRDDATEIGELKRLVTVLLQEIDDWPPAGLLIAATNHPDLLDPAVWRRFEMLVEFPMPNTEQAYELVSALLSAEGIGEQTLKVIAGALSHFSFSEIERDLTRAKRSAVMNNSSVEEALTRIVHDRLSNLTIQARKEAAGRLLQQGLTQSDVHAWTGVHRDVIRKMQKVAPRTRKGGLYAG
jgi:SpoVK/Ycf46/Vps4 family AAA+-type ATPase